MNTDQSLGDTAAEHTTPTATAPTSTQQGATPFGNPNGPTDPQPPAEPVRQWTIDDILATAKTPERHARVCLRADLEAEHEQIVAELATLVDAQGKVMDDDERSGGEVSKAARVQQLVARDEELLAEMAKSMWFPLFRGLTTDELTDFNRLHKPKPRADGEDPDMSEYNTLLVAECSVASKHGPKLSVDDVRALRKKIGSRAIGEMDRTAHAVCTLGGADVPKLPGSWAGLKQQ